jgi:hypothetical protein
MSAFVEKDPASLDRKQRGGYTGTVRMNSGFADAVLWFLDVAWNNVENEAARKLRSDRSLNAIKAEKKSKESVLATMFRLRQDRWSISVFKKRIGLQELRRSTD